MKHTDGQLPSAESLQVATAGASSCTCTLNFLCLSQRLAPAQRARPETGLCDIRCASSSSFAANPRALSAAPARVLAKFSAEARTLHRRQLQVSYQAPGLHGLKTFKELTLYLCLKQSPRLASPTAFPKLDTPCLWRALGCMSSNVFHWIVHDGQ